MGICLFLRGLVKRCLGHTNCGKWYVSLGPSARFTYGVYLFFVLALFVVWWWCWLFDDVCMVPNSPTGQVLRTGPVGRSTLVLTTRLA